MSKAFPDTFYHSLSQARLEDAAKHPALRGLSRFHLDPEGKNLGVWMSDNLPLLVEGGYGNEQSDEVIGEFNYKGETIAVKKPIMSVVLQFEGLDEGQILQHPILPEQFFHIGDIPWTNVRKMLVREHDEDAEKTARELVGALKDKFGAEIGIETFNPGIGLERKWGKLSPESNRNTLDETQNKRGSENKLFEKNILPKDREGSRY